MNLVALKDILFTGYLRSGYVQWRDALQGRQGRARAVILCYHRIGGQDVLSKPTAEFRRDLAYLKRHYECITLAELSARLQAGQPFRQRVAVITFDDGYKDNYTEAVPALKAAGVPATFFVATGFMGTERTFPHDIELAERYGVAVSSIEGRFPKLTWDDLRAMQADGFEIGSHTVEHVSLGQADAPTVERELQDSLTTLNKELGTRPRPFAFPFGKPRDISEQALEMIQQAGYYAAVFAYGGSNTRGANPFRLQRLDAGNGFLSPPALRAKVAGLDTDYLRLKLRGINFNHEWKRGLGARV